MKNVVGLLFLVCSLSLFACADGTLGLIEKGDGIFNSGKDRYDFFFTANEVPLLYGIGNEENANLHTAILVLNNELNVYEEKFVGESGDYVNTYKQYYDHTGVLKAFKITSRFFNSGQDNEPVTEERLYKYCEHLILLEHKVFDANMQILDTTSIVFNYRFHFDVAPNLHSLSAYKALNLIE